MSVHRLLHTAGISATITAMDECDPADLVDVNTAVMIASSFGEVGRPTTAHASGLPWRAIQSP